MSIYKEREDEKNDAGTVEYTSINSGSVSKRILPPRLLATIAYLASRHAHTETLCSTKEGAQKH